MSTIIVYQSKYGHTEQYAKWLSKKLNDAPYITLEDATNQDLTSYRMIIFGAPIYAGTIKGKEFLSRHLDKQLIIFTVGIADPTETDYLHPIHDTRNIS